MREAGKGSVGISFSLSLPRASLTARRHKSIKGSGSAGKKRPKTLILILLILKIPPQKSEHPARLQGQAIEHSHISNFSSSNTQAEHDVSVEVI